jgi:hypothetical protein
MPPIRAKLDALRPAIEGAGSGGGVGLSIRERGRMTRMALLDTDDRDGGACPFSPHAENRCDGSSVVAITTRSDAQFSILEFC